MPLWMEDGHLVMEDGHVVLCDECPCETGTGTGTPTLCDGCLGPTRATEIVAEIGAGTNGSVCSSCSLYSGASFVLPAVGTTSSCVWQESAVDLIGSDPCTANRLVFRIQWTAPYSLLTLGWTSLFNSPWALQVLGQIDCMDFDYTLTRPGGSVSCNFPLDARVYTL